ncbi:MAG: LysM peptidoglycan-binding domain-containing protein [Deltaproteobacteria bacterium]|nr:LysM peptidoglycan-binding domain-containing protein [Deltaproteobacteria bacterium]
MRKAFQQLLAVSSLLILLLPVCAFSEREDTAQLTFSKKSAAKNATMTYSVQKGDVLSAIIRRLPGITERDIPHYYQLTKELNPDITDLDKLYEGQNIRLPVKSPAAPGDTASSFAAPAPEATGSQTYHVRKGDTLIRIARRELHVASRTQTTLLVIKSMNPNIRDVNKIYVGQMLRLPDRTGGPAANRAVPDKSQSVTRETESPLSDSTDAKAKDSIILTPAERIAVIKHIIAQMKGNMITTGNYYLPVSRTEQLTIDCATIPVIEFEDQTTVLLDLHNRANAQLKKIIGDRWRSHHLVKIDDKDDIIVMLKKIFSISKTYEITKSQSPLSIGSVPPMEVLVDWIITRKNTGKSTSLNQGLRFVYEDSGLLPRAVVNYAKQNSWIITEISQERGLAAKPEEIYSLPPLTVLPTSSSREFAFALISYLGIPGEKDADVKIFNIEKDGFNLSIKADVVVTRGEKKILIFSRNLPPQFIQILEKSGSELIFVSDQDDPVKNMEKLLRGFSFVFTSGYFTFSGLDKNQPPYHFGFNGTKIKTDQSLYVVNFDFNSEIRGLMQETWSTQIIRY